MNKFIWKEPDIKWLEKKAMNINAVNSFSNWISKTTKEYLKPGEKAPEGYRTFRGKRGGFYYIPKESKLAQRWYEQSKPKLRIMELEQQEFPTLESRKQALLNFVPPVYRNKHVQYNRRLLLSKDPKIFAIAGEWLVKWEAKDKKIQITYSRKHLEESDEKKFEKLNVVTKVLPKIRDLYSKNLQSKNVEKRAVAAIIALIDLTGFRIGSEDYAQEHGTYGISSLRVKHIKLFSNNKIVLNFVGKKSVKFENVKVQVSDSLYSVLEKFKSGKSPNEKMFPVEEDDVRDTLKPFGISPKDLRTYHANRLLYEELKKAPKYAGDVGHRETRIKDIIKRIASKLGHSWTVSRNSYLNPLLVRTYLDKGEVLEGIVKAYDKSKLVPKKVMVRRDGKTFYAIRWTRFAELKIKSERAGFERFMPKDRILKQIFEPLWRQYVFPILPASHLKYVNRVTYMSINFYEKKPKYLILPKSGHALGGQAKGRNIELYGDIIKGSIDKDPSEVIALMVHEVGHAVHKAISTKKRNEITELYDSLPKKRFPTKYSLTNEDEMFAEAYSFYYRAPELLKVRSAELFNLMKSLEQ